MDRKLLKPSNINKLKDIRTPFYLYDMKLFRETVSEVVRLSSLYGIDVHYAVKANAGKPFLRHMASEGFGADCVSGNEVLCALENGFSPDKIAFAGVGKTDREIETALENGIFALTCESLPEISVINELAGRLGKKADILVRINPDIDAHTHKYITTGLEENKFGVSGHDFDALTGLLADCGNVNFKGLHFHIGSQILDVEEVFGLECRRAKEIARYFEDKGLEISHIDLGGGLGVDYEAPDEHPVPDFEKWFRTIAEGMTGGKRENPRYHIHIEPGRSIVAQCGSLITRVLFVKNGIDKTFLITDAGMNDLIRPALYGASHRIVNLTAESDHEGDTAVYDVVGPVCESSDVWAEGISLPAAMRGDMLAILSAGAYGQVMASRYNLRDLAPAVWLDWNGDEAVLSF